MQVSFSVPQLGPTYFLVLATPLVLQYTCKHTLPFGRISWTHKFMTVLTALEIHPTETVNHRGIHTVIIFLNGLIFNLLEHFTPLDIGKFSKTWRSQ